MRRSPLATRAAARPHRREDGETAPFQPGAAAAGNGRRRCSTTISARCPSRRRSSRRRRPSSTRACGSHSRSTTPRRSARSARRRSSIPKCALCFWGEALILGPNINVPMMPEANAPALAALAKAVDAARPSAPPRDRALIEALSAALFGRSEGRARGARRGVRRRDGAGRAHAIRADDTVQALYAEALMDTQPWDYWEAGGAKPKGNGAAIVDTLENGAQAQPEASGRDPSLHPRGRGVDARPSGRCRTPTGSAALMPGAGHIVHMPAHIYYRVGHVPRFARRQQRAIGGRRALLPRPRRPTRCTRRRTTRTTSTSSWCRRRWAATAKTAIDAAAKLDAAMPAELVRAVRDHAAGQGGAVHDARAVRRPRRRSSRCPRRPTNSSLVRRDVPLRARASRSRARTTRRGASRDRRARAHRARRRLQAVRRVGRSGEGDRARPRGWSRRAGSPMPTATSTAPPRPTRRRSFIEDTLALHGAAVLVLPGAPVARRRAAAPGQARRRREGLPRIARARAQQRLGARRPGRDVPPQGRRRGCEGGAAGVAKAWFGNPEGRRSIACSGLRVMTPRSLRRAPGTLSRRLR